MRSLLGLAAVAALLLAGAAQAQPLPPGDYRSRCRDISMNGLFLSATCGGVRGGGQSSINVQSCPGANITVDASGALVCAGVAGPVPVYPGPPQQIVRPPQPGYGRDVITVYARKNWQGREMRLDETTPNLANLGMNDHIRSLRLGRRSGPWLVCEDAGFRGRCVRIDRDIADARRIGMAREISSLRPVR